MGPSISLSPGGTSSAPVDITSSSSVACPQRFWISLPEGTSSHLRALPWRGGLETALGLRDCLCPKLPTCGPQGLGALPGSFRLGMRRRSASALLSQVNPDPRHTLPLTPSVGGENAGRVVMRNFLDWTGGNALDVAQVEPAPTQLTGAIVVVAVTMVRRRG